MACTTIWRQPAKCLDALQHIDKCSDLVLWSRQVAVLRHRRDTVQRGQPSDLSIHILSHKAYNKTGNKKHDRQWLNGGRTKNTGNTRKQCAWINVDLHLCTNHWAVLAYGHRPGANHHSNNDHKVIVHDTFPIVGEVIAWNAKSTTTSNVNKIKKIKDFQCHEKNSGLL